MRLQGIDHMRGALQYFIHHLNCKAGVLKKSGRPTGCHQGKSIRGKLSGNRQSRWLITLADAQEGCPFFRQHISSRKLGFGKGHGKGVVHPHDLAG